VEGGEQTGTPSTSTFKKTTLVNSLAIRANNGATILHGPHQVAVKSTHTCSVASVSFSSRQSPHLQCPIQTLATKRHQPSVSALLCLRYEKLPSAPPSPARR